MNTTDTLYVLTAAMVSLLLQWFYPALANGAPIDLAGSSSTNIQMPSSRTNAMNETQNLFRTIVDENSGKYSVADTNKEVVTLKDKTGEVIWSINVAEKLKTDPNPKLRGRKIEGIQLHNGDLWITVGRGYVIIDLKTGGLNKRSCFSLGSSNGA